MTYGLRIGLPGMHAERGERRAFLPGFVGRLERLGFQVMLEQGYGGGMGFVQADYQEQARSVNFGDLEQVYQQDYVLVLRCPAEDQLRLLKPGACLIAMLHYPTRPKRTEMIRSLGVQAISLDSLKDDSGRRLVENLRAVAWNGMEAAYQALRSVYPPPGLDNPQRGPLRVTLMGAGAVGLHVVQAAIRYANEDTWRAMAARGVPGVQVRVIDYDTTGIEQQMLPVLSETDILVDATQRPDPSRAVIPNNWIGVMPKHAVLLDLSVDPYDCDQFPPRNVKGIEGIPQGDLDQYIFVPDDPAYQQVPDCIPKQHRRQAVSCYSWPGVHPKACMAVYGKQLNPIMRTLAGVGGVEQIKPEGRFFERVISRALLSNWPQLGIQ